MRDDKVTSETNEVFYYDNPQQKRINTMTKAELHKKTMELHEKTVGLIDVLIERVDILNEQVDLLHRRLNLLESENK